MTILETSQIIFNLVVSLAVIVITVFVSVIAYGIIKFSRAFKDLIDSLNRESSELYEKINNFLETLFNLSFISKFFKKKKSK
jgi:F0F1-type ATP synthase membrane subunit a